MLLLQALSSLPAGLGELLRSLHVHTLRNDEVLLLKDSRRLAEHKDAGPQVGVRPFILKECTRMLSKAEVGRKQGSEGGE